ncbi:MAG: hypothetical protein LC640_09250 [Frankia sp.]|nr:hypothetical protein [Frankia sp.]
MSMNLTNEQRAQEAQHVRGLASPAAMEIAAEMAKDADPLNDELQAMRSIARTLDKLPYEAAQRVLTWLNGRTAARILGLAQGGIAPAGYKGYP